MNLKHSLFRIVAAGLLAFTGATFTAVAQPTPSEATEVAPSTTLQFAPVTVQGLGNPATVSYANLLKGVDAFADNHSLAPNAPLKFRVHDISKSTEPLKIRIETDDKVVPIVTDPDGSFTLPGPEVVGASQGEIVANRRSGDLIIHPLILSPGYNLEQGRLGDYRLWCEVVFAIMSDDVPLGAKIVGAISGGLCKSSRVKLFKKQGDRKVLEATLVQGDKKVAALMDAKGNAFSLPLHDSSWGNEAAVEVVFAKD